MLYKVNLMSVSRFCQIIGFSILVSSCSPVFYAPSTQNVPLLKEKGEVNIGGGYSNTDRGEGISLNFAVAVDSSWAVAGSFNSLGGGEKNATDSWRTTGNYFEAAAGKFNSSPTGPWVYEAFLGLGYGAINNEINNDFVDAKFLKPYLQPTFGLRTKHIDFVITPRLSVVNYISEDIRINEPVDERRVLDFFDEKGTTFVFEPGATLRLGIRNVKIQLQYVYSSFSYDSRDEDEPFDSEMLTVGLNFYPK